MNVLVTTLLYFLIAKGNCVADSSINSMLLAYKSGHKNIKLLSFRSDNSKPDVSKKVHFHLYTRKNDVKQELFPDNLKSLETSNYNRSLLTKIVVHGFFGTPNKPMAQSIKHNFLASENVNVIVVDWSYIAVSINYNEVCRNTRPVGAYLASLIDTLVVYGTQPKNIHLIGHSLGAHVSGFAGAVVKSGKIARITGLDPARPNFDEVPPSDRLDPSDAQFVDCIHTCGGLLGLHEPICTVDFYPNGGIHVQPGCTFIDFGHCSHMRAFIYFAESINPEYKYPALECNLVPDDSKSPSNCIRSTTLMGYNTESDVHGIYFVATNRQQPFAPIHP